MADRFDPPKMDWTSPGDIHKRFKFFKQKCELIFDGPLEKQTEKKKVQLLLLWIGDKGLEIYNTATWVNDGDDYKLKPVFQHLENYTKPSSNHILARFQLRSLKQGDMTLEEFVTKARSLIDDGGYSQNFKEETLRDTLVFGITSDKARKDAISLGNKLTFQQVYDLAKTEESAKKQMEVISKGMENIDSETHSIHSKKSTPKPQGTREWRANKNTDQSNQRKFNFKVNGCFRCGNKHNRSTTCPALHQTCKYCGKSGHFAKVCMTKRMKEVQEIVDSPDYQGQDIHLQEVEDNEGDTCNSEHNEPINVFVGAVESEHTIIDNHHNRIYANVTLNDKHKIKMKVDTGADACVITTDDLQELPFPVTIKQSNSILKAYGGGLIQNLGVTTLKVTVNSKSITTQFNIVEATGSPSMIGCKQSQELGIITVKVHNVNSPQPSRETESQKAASKGTLTESNIMQDYKDCFDKVGRFPGDKYHIQLIEKPTPVIHPPRTVALHILPLYKAELDKMLEDNIITEVTEPTDWVNSIVCKTTNTPEGNLKVRLCLDPKDLNENIKREHYYTRTIDEILPQLHDKKYFSVADTRKGYYHVELDHESSLLCTFNTPFGRYRFNRLPFGVNVSQDIFQRKLDDVYQGIPNVTGIADDILITGSTKEEHDQAFINMLEATRKNNIGLNSTKLQFKQPSVQFFGHTITSQGIQPSTAKLEAIKNLQPPTNAKELLSILGTITYLNRYSTKLADLAAPLRQLTKKNVHFRWEQHHQSALDKIKEELCTAKILAYYDPSPTTTTILQCDASQEGLGAWIRQLDSNGQEKIIAMSSRSLTNAEKKYSNIERECLAVAYGLDKFEYYLLGRHVKVETDHSPLENIFKKNIAETPSRLQRLLLRCLRFDIEVKYKPGKHIPVADTLSRVCFQKDENDCGDHDVHFVTNTTCPIDIELVKAKTTCDTNMCTLKDIIYRGWPAYRRECPLEVQEYWNFRYDLVLEDGLILKGDKILMPASLRKQALDAIHTGHQGETKCILLARETVFWPGISDDIRKMVKKCEVCNKHQPAQARLPAMQPDLPTHPWQKLATDIFEMNGSKYLMVVDYYSRFPVIRLLKDMTANSVCNHFTSIIAEYGLPECIVADCGTQYISEQFKRFCETRGITITYSSPYHHQANGLAEKAVGSCKSLLLKAVEDKQCPYTAIWTYRVTPLDNSIPSPYELLFGRKPRQILPCSKSSLKSHHPDNEKHMEANHYRQLKQAGVYNSKAGRERRSLYNKEPVYVRNTLKGIWQPGTVLNRPNPGREPRTYVVDVDGTLYQRTREHLRPREVEIQQAPKSTDKVTPTIQPPKITRLDTPPQQEGHQEQQQQPAPQQTTRSGRVVRAPERFGD